jgi:ribonuclease HI
MTLPDIAEAMTVPATLYFDGASKGNPGPSGAGAVLVTTSQRVPVQHPLPFMATNNVAEYTALIEGLRLALRHGVTHLEVVGDSELVVRQMTGTYDVKAAHLRPLRSEALGLARQFTAVRWTSVPRAQNAEADALANRAANAAEAMRERLVSYDAWRASSGPTRQVTVGE